jgi:hypothetical protein
VTLPRLLREIFRALYWTGTVGLAATVALSATFGAYRRPAVDEADLVPADVRPDDADGRRCVERVRVLDRELVERAGRTFVGDGGPSPDFAADWADWSRSWRLGLERTRGACRLRESPAMRPVAELADSLERLHLAYTTALLGFSDVGRRELIKVRKLYDELGLAERPAR